MDDLTALLAEASAAGLRLEVAGDAIVVRGPKSAEPIVHRLREAKPAVLALLRSPRPPVLLQRAPALDPATVREVLGHHYNEHDLGILRLDLLAALRLIELEIENGVINERVRMIRGRPLGDWLDLDEVARLLRLGGRR